MGSRVLIDEQTFLSFRGKEDAQSFCFVLIFFFLFSFSVGAVGVSRAMIRTLFLRLLRRLEMTTVFRVSQL